MFGMNSRAMRRAAQKQLQRDNLSFGVSMEPVPEPWPYQQGVRVIAVFRPRHYLAQLVEEERTGGMRLSVCRTELDGGRWRGDIPWEELQRVKSECGLGKSIAVEVYPEDVDVVNVANMRHLWIMPDDFPFVWRKVVSQ